MLKTLKTLIRIQDSKVQDLRRKLNKAQQQETDAKKRLQDFIDVTVKEAEIAGQDYLMAASYSNYLDYANNQKDKLALLVRDAEAVNQIARNNLNEAYREMKNFETIQTKKKQEHLDMLEKLEQKELDDLVQTTYKPDAWGGKK